MSTPEQRATIRERVDRQGPIWLDDLRVLLADVERLEREMTSLRARAETYAETERLMLGINQTVAGERDAALAREGELRAEVAELLPYRDADAMTISNLCRQLGEKQERIGDLYEVVYVAASTPLRSPMERAMLHEKADAALKRHAEYNALLSRAPADAPKEGS